MPEFQMDKSGAVVGVEAKSLAPGEVTLWKDLDAFTQGYIEAMFFTEEREHVDGEDIEESGSIPHNSCFGMIEAESLAAIVSYCKRFQDVNAALLERAYEHGGRNGEYDAERAGHDLWYTSQGHGVGYWDRGLEDVGQELADQCGFGHAFTEQYVETGDDGVIHVR